MKTIPVRIIISLVAVAMVVALYSAVHADSISFGTPYWVTSNWSNSTSPPRGAQASPNNDGIICPGGAIQTGWRITQDSANAATPYSGSEYGTQCRQPSLAVTTGARTWVTSNWSNSTTPTYGAKASPNDGISCPAGSVQTGWRIIAIDPGMGGDEYGTQCQPLVSSVTLGTPYWVTSNWSNTTSPIRGAQASSNNDGITCPNGSVQTGWRIIYTSWSDAYEPEGSGGGYDSYEYGTQCRPISSTVTPPPPSSCNVIRSFTSPGAYTYTVPSGAFTVQVWGGGGGGGASWASNGSAGGRSAFGNVTANGGSGGSGGISSGSPAQGGNGGIASGGDTNMNGTQGLSGTFSGGGNGGGSPNGGNGGAGSPSSTGGSGLVPGGGGGGAGRYYPNFTGGAGGGGGGYASKTYASGALVSGNEVTVVVGTGGAGGDIDACTGGLACDGGSGASGAVNICRPSGSAPTCSVTFDQNPLTGSATTMHWTSTGANLFYINQVGWVGASGSAQVSSPGDYSGTVSGAGGSGGGNSRTFSTPGTYTFTVPQNAGSISVTVNGAGGGGGGMGDDIRPGSVGGASSFGGVVVAQGGGGGTVTAYTSSPGTPGTASGGDTNTTGGGASGGAGGTLVPNATGGNGGQAVKSYSSGALSGTATVVVGARGAGGATANPSFAGHPGGNGSVTITWTGGSGGGNQTYSCPAILAGPACSGPNCPDSCTPSSRSCNPATGVIA